MGHSINTLLLIPLTQLSIAGADPTSARVAVNLAKCPRNKQNTLRDPIRR